MRILLVEDDRGIGKVVKKRLSAEGYAVDWCETGPDGYDYLRAAEYDVALMDVMLPGMDGLTVVRHARSEGVDTPVLFLTARDTVADRVTGLDAGGDDYLVKPFALDELMARIRVLARRRGTQPRATNHIRLADLEVDPAARKVTRAGQEIALTSLEYSLLEYLLRNQGAVLTRDQIVMNVFSADYMGASNVVDVYISYLRKKIDEGAPVKLIHTVRGVGYVLREKA